MTVIADGVSPRAAPPTHELWPFVSNAISPVAITGILEAAGHPFLRDLGRHAMSDVRAEIVREKILERYPCVVLDLHALGPRADGQELRLANVRQQAVSDDD